MAAKGKIDALAAAYIDGKPLPAIETLATKDVLGKGTLRVARANCEVALIARQAVPPAAR